jgi:translocation and assembly module TamB
LRRFARLLALVMICAFPNGAAAQTTSDERSYVQAFLEDNLSDAGREVRITGFAGGLSARATIDELTIADANGVWLTLRDVVLDWDRGALLRGRLEIGELSAKELFRFAGFASARSHAF